MTTNTYSLEDLRVSLDDVLTPEEYRKHSKNNISFKLKKNVVAAAAAGTILTTTMIAANVNNTDNEPYNVLAQAPITETVTKAPENYAGASSVNDRTNTTVYYALQPVALSADVAEELADTWDKIPQSVKESNVLKGVIIENKDQLKALQSKEIVYSNEVLPIQFIENGKANVSKAVRSFEPIVRAELAKVDREELTEFMLALLQQESGGSAEILGSDPFQSSQSKNEVIGSITDPSESVAQGIAAFTEKLKLNNMDDALNHGDIRTAIQSYNFGGRISRIAEENKYGYSMKFIQDQSASLAVEYNKPIGKDWRGAYSYGDFSYVPKIFNYFEPQADWELKAQEAAAAVLEEQATTKEAESEKEVLVEETSKTTLAKPTTSSSEEEIYAYEQQLYKDKIASINSYFSKVQVEAPAASDALKGKVIVVDAGHGGHDPGALNIDKTLKEADINLAVAKQLEKNLKAQGATVIMTRSTAGEFMEVHKRGQLAKEKGADLLISVHANSFSNENKTYDYIPSGVETYKGLGGGSQAFAETVHPYIADALSMINDRGVKAGSHYGVLNNSSDTGEVDALLFELGFVKSPVDSMILTNANAQTTIANAITHGVIKYAGTTVEKEVVTPPAEEKEEVVEKEEIIESDSSKQETTESEQPEVDAPANDESDKEASDEVSDEEVSEKEDVENTEDNEESPSDDQASTEETKEEEVKEQEESIAERLLRMFSVD